MTFLAKKSPISLLIRIKKKRMIKSNLSGSTLTISTSAWFR